MNRITYCFFVLFFFAFFQMGIAQGVVINEVLTSNTAVNTDEDDTYQDWVELYNAGAASLNLNGYGLTDDATLPYKWTFPNVSLAPGAYLLVWCSDKNRIIPGQPLHTNWKISSGGETITLTNAGGVTVNTAPAQALQENMSWGRLPNGTGPFVFFTAVTPNAVNSAVGFNEILSPPTFSQGGGFSLTSFNLTLSTTTPGANIIYTLDGSEPSATNLAGTSYTYRNSYEYAPGDSQGPLLTKSYNTLQYSAPITIVDRTSQANDISTISTTFHNVAEYIPSYNIFKGTVVRARVVKAGALASDIVTNTYFVTPEGAAKFGVPVISLSVNEDRLFDYGDGIFVAGKDFDDWRDANPTEDAEYADVANYTRRGAEYEKRGHFNYFVNGTEMINQELGIRTKGGHSRTFPSKSLNLYAKSDYGDDDFSYKFFDELPYTTFERLTLRNGGGDFYGTMFRDDLLHRVCSSLHCETESSQPAVTFLNGEYWGILNVREKYDDNYFQQVYGFSNVDLLENFGGEDEIEEGDNLDWLNLTNYMETHNLTGAAEYNYVLTRMDPESFADNYIANIYFDNVDWPGTNTTYWRKHTAAYEPNAPYGQDGRWRWAFHDLDDTMSVTSESISHDNLASATATNGPDWPNPPSSTLFLRKLLQNETFKNYFINRFADLMNSHFMPARVIDIMGDLQAEIQPEMPDHFPRWKTLLSMSDFSFYINTETDFANQRAAFQRTHIRSNFTIASNINATLEVSAAAHGYIKISTIDIKDGTPGIVGNPYPWTGIYFSNVPVTLKAVPNDGYVFSHWTGASTSTSDVITINSAASFSVTAVFVPTAVLNPQPVYFWLMDGAIPNDTPLTGLNSTYEATGTDASIAYASCLVGYPFNSADPNWRKASMERRNAPTDINYFPEANNNVVYAPAMMKGLQITQPFQSGGLENTLVFNVSTSGYEDIKFAFAAKNENAADAIVLDYSTAAGAPVWQTAGITSSMPLTASFQLFNTDFTAITAANNNANFKVRLRFTGPDMTLSNGDRVTFNNISMIGTPLQLGVTNPNVNPLSVYPNPTTDVINIAGTNGNVTYQVYTIEGRMVKSGTLAPDAQVSLAELNTGMYLLQLVSEGKTQTRKIIKR